MLGPAPTKQERSKNGRNKKTQVFFKGGWRLCNSDPLQGGLSTTYTLLPLLRKGCREEIFSKLCFLTLSLLCFKCPLYICRERVLDNGVSHCQQRTGGYATVILCKAVYLPPILSCLCFERGAEKRSSLSFVFLLCRSCALSAPFIYM